MVEAALVLPLYVFLILGTMQLMLAYQARLLTKYAAYKAVRAGALHNGKVSEMEKAALAALLPVLSHQQASIRSETIEPIKDVSSYRQKWSWAKDNKMTDANNMKLAQVTICGPLKGDVSGNELDFDDPATGFGTGWKDSERTKLRIQLTLNYRMPIPFANVIIHAIARAQEIPAVLRLGKKGASEVSKMEQAYQDAAKNGLYILPIRAEYTERMQSNLYATKAPLPTENLCVFPFSY